MAATPIGNLADLTLRTIHVLQLADAVACEDTRVASTLLLHLGLRKPFLAVHEHNEREAAGDVIARLRLDERVVFICDAGTPAVSDPGARLVAAVRAAGHRCIPLPGASAVPTALSVAGAVSDEAGFRFAGFLPAKGAARRDRLAAVLQDEGAVVLYESPHRIATLGDELAQAAPKRTVTVARELTKQFEDVQTLAACELPAWFEADAQRRRGEFVLVLHPQPQTRAVEGAIAGEVQRLLTVLLRELPLRQAVALVAEVTGAARNTLYEAALAQQKQGRDKDQINDGHDSDRHDNDSHASDDHASDGCDGSEPPR